MSGFDLLISAVWTQIRVQSTLAPTNFIEFRIRLRYETLVS